MSKIIPSFLLVAGLCAAADITYDVDQTVGGGSVTGEIVTDGTIGTLNQLNIQSFNLLLNDTVNTYDMAATIPGGGWGAAAGDGLAFFGPSQLTATATQLTYNFSGSGELLFQADINETGQQFVCFESDSGCSGSPAGISLSASTGFANQQNTELSGSQVIAEASGGAPEPATFALLGLGLAALGFRSRRRSADSAL